MSRCWRLLLRRGAGDLEERLAAVRQGIAPLRRHAAATEESFLALGRSLQAQHALATELLDCTRRFARFSDRAGDGHGVTRAETAVRQALAAVERLASRNGELLASLRTHQTDIAQLRQRAVQLEQAIAPLRIIEVLFRIEAANLPSEAQAAFTGLTQDIARLDGEVRDTFERQFDALGRTHEAIREVGERLGGDRIRQERFIKVQRETIDTALARLEPGLRTLREEQARITDLAGRVERESGAIIVGLQFQDITRQRLEHVITAVSDLTSVGSDRGRDAAIGREVAGLEAGQLAAIEQDLTRALATVEGGMHQVVAALDDLGAPTNADGVGDAADRVNDTTETLLALMASLREPLAQAIRTVEATAATIESFRGFASNLAEVIRALTWAIRLIALNAQVQAARVEDCDGLEVLARQTYAVSDQTAAVAEALGEKLGRLTRGLVRLAEETRALAAEVAASGREHQEAIDAATARLREERSAVLGAIGEFEPLVGRSREAARTLVGVISRGVDLAPLRDVRQELQQLEEAFRGRMRRSRDRDAQTRVLTQLERRYTMRSEREVHAAAVAGGGGGLAPEPAVEAAPAAAEAANVELF